MTKYVPELVVFSKAAKLSSDSVKKSTNLDTPTGHTHIWSS